jgi:small ligand-binding sensory domain FIST
VIRADTVMPTTFVQAHAAHAQPRAAFAAVAAQIDDQRARGSVAQPTLGWLYLTDLFADQAPALLALARERWPGVAWVGAVGVGVCASGVEHFGEGALALMLTDMPRKHFRVFSGAQPLPATAGQDFSAQTALVHADPATPELGELIGEMSERVASGYLFGGLASSLRAPGTALLVADGVWAGGLSGVAFDAQVPIVSRVTQGSQPIGPQRTVTAAQGPLVLELGGEPALDLLLNDLGLEGTTDLRAALPRLRGTLVGLSDGQTAAPATVATRRAHAFGADVRVRHIVGLDPARRAVAIADRAEVGQQLAFSRRDAEAARRDLVRICAEIRDELSPEELPFATAVGAPAQMARTRSAAAARAGQSEAIAGAIYVSCAGRGGPHFGAPSAELAIIHRALGDVPLVGFFAAGEIGHRHLYGYTGVLTVFAA